MRGVDVLCHSIIQCRTFSTGDLMVNDEAMSAPSIIPTSEQIGLQLESTSEPVSIPATSLVLATSGLQLVICSRSPIPVIDLDSMITSLTSLVANTLNSMKTPSQLVPVSSALLMTASATPSTIVTTKLPETSPSKLTRSPGVIEAEKEFMWR